MVNSLLQKAGRIITLVSLSACAHVVNVLDGVKPGMNREQAVASASGSPTPYYLKGETTEYVLFRVVTNFYSMYDDYPNDILFIRLENGGVVAKGVVGSSEEQKIREIKPSFVLRDWQREGPVPSDQTQTQ